MHTVRPPAVAGTFYPGQSAGLLGEVSLDFPAMQAIAHLPQVLVSAAVHAQEHASGCFAQPQPGLRRRAGERPAAGRAKARSAAAASLGRSHAAAEEAPWLQEWGATFVTLSQQGQWRGCIGSLQAHRPLLADLKANAVAAALHDPRFAPLTAQELDATQVEVSVLSALQPLSFASESEALAQLRPGVDGGVLEYGRVRSTFLPQVWEQLPLASQFLERLKLKADLPADFWAPEVKLQRYTVRKFSESDFCIDPIEKKPLNHFYPGSSVLSFGTAGCNLSCKFCQNWDISKSRDMDRLMDQAAPETIALEALKYGCQSVAFTYNDPVIFAEYAMDVADACHAQGIQTVAVRDWYEIRQYRLNANGACPDCGAAMEGRFDASAGGFGRRRIPIALGRN